MHAKETHMHSNNASIHAYTHHTHQICTPDAPACAASLSSSALPAILTAISSLVRLGTQVHTEACYLGAPQNAKADLCTAAWPCRVAIAVIL